MLPNLEQEISRVLSASLHEFPASFVVDSAIPKHITRRIANGQRTYPFIISKPKRSEAGV